MNKLSLAIFLTLFSAVYLGAHFYLYTRVVNGLQLQGIARSAVKLLVAAGAAAFFAGELLSRREPLFFSKPIALFGSSWLGFLAIAFSVFVLADLLRLVVHQPGFRHSATIVALALAAGGSIFSLGNTALPRRMKEIPVVLPALPAHLAGFRIVQLSDIHLHLLTSPSWLRTLVYEVNALQPDLIVITGDLIDADLRTVPAICGILKELRATHGIYAVTGNHEFYTGIPAFMDIARQANITVLRNSRTTIANGIELAGIDDPGRERGAAMARNLHATLNGSDPRKPLVLLSHQPDIFDTAVRQGVGLQLSGHTHAGQIPPIDLMTLLVFKYPAGLYRHGNAYCYTTTGTAWWGPPMRLFSRSEIVTFVLTNK
jgi:predicted MPP superfamily phosphohydrolase